MAAMETSAPKRRKTSPLTAVPIESTTPAANTTTPPDPPPPAPHFRPDTVQDTESRTARAASYASPTKASLAKHNPDILLKRLSSPTKARHTGASTDHPSQPQMDQSSPQPDKQLREDHERATSLALRSPTRQLGGGLAARPRRTPVKPNPRPLPPPGPEDDDLDDMLNPFARRGLRRSPLAGLAEPEPPEPELPPTPVGLDNAASTPPAGIHSTPSRRPRRSRALAEKIRSSPTKQPPTKQAAGGGPQGDEQVLPTTEAQSSSLRPRSGKRVDRQRNKPKSRPRPSNVRGIQPADPNAEKKRERDALEAEVAELERDLDLVARENERIRQLRLSRKDTVLPPDKDRIFDVLERHLLPRRTDAKASQSLPWLEHAFNPINFLPFGKPASSLPILFPEDNSGDEPEQEPTSHHPVPLTAEEALPFLQAFTPLTFTSRLSMLPQPDYIDNDNSTTVPAPPLLQHHSITATSATSPGLFSARIELTVNTLTHAITTLTIPSIDPPPAAAELSPLTLQILAEPEASSGALSRNVGVLTWGMGSWLRVAVRRAKVWRTLDRQLGSTDDLARTLSRVKAASGQGRRSKRKARDEDAATEQGGEKDGDSVATEDWIDSLVDTDDLLPYMGRQGMEFRIPSKGSEQEASVLAVQWRIEFDWTGEATSRIKALAKVPGKWHRADERTTLSGIPTLFDKLLQKGAGVVPAVETIVTLLAGKQR
ncbi:hypothetical protein GE09DRAFT_1218372 [Coniochaeta sp. 2T2.1]|nr:hypothetical protein GE09DRAFT_1218372 [Coniochaeta sp. 2T2.1]